MLGLCTRRFEKAQKFQVIYNITHNLQCVILVNYNKLTDFSCIFRQWEVPRLA